MLHARDLIRIVLAVLVINGVLTRAEADKAILRADESLPNAPIDELSLEQLIDCLK